MIETKLLSKWWRTKSCRDAFKRARQKTKARIAQLRKNHRKKRHH